MNRNGYIRFRTIVYASVALAALSDVGVAQTAKPDTGGPERNTQEALPSQPGGGPLRREVLPVLPSPPTILAPEHQPIDLNTALRLAGVQNPELNVVRQRVLEAAAERQLAAAQFLPSLNPGTNYDSHTGVLQQSNGNMLSVQRSAVYVGAGSNAVAAGSVNIPGVFLAMNVGQQIYTYLASRQLVRQREFDVIAVRNQVFLQVALAYSELLRSEGRRAVGLQAREEARTVAKLTADYARAGEGRLADANRAATELARREAFLQSVEGELLAASARLCQLLNLDPSIRLHPTDAFVVPQPIVPDPIPVAELIALGLLRRPELAAQRSAIERAFLQLEGMRILPFSPTVMVGFSAGGFGGGSNLVRPIFGGFGGRTDLDAVAYWTIQNLGVGNVALIRGANARLQAARFEQIAVLNMVRSQVAEAYAKTHARYAQIETNEHAVRSGFLSFHEDLDRIKLRAERDVLPIELLDSFRLLARARLDYVDSIVDYNRAQFEMYVALGQPPADALAHPVPTEGVFPKGLATDGKPAAPGERTPAPPEAAPAAPATAPAAAASAVPGNAVKPASYNPPATVTTPPSRGRAPIGR